MTASPEAMQQTIDSYIAAYRANDKAAVLSLYTEDCEWIDPVGTPTNHGHAGVSEFWDNARAMADSIVLEPVRSTICGNEAAVAIEIHITLGGSQFIMDAIDIFVFNDDAKIASGKAYWDMSAARPA